MPRKIALVGTASSRGGAPVDDESWEIWGVSARGELKRADRWYEIHPLDVTFDKPHEPDAWRKELKRQCEDVPVLLMMFPEPGLHHNIKPYPETEIRARFDTFLLTSTFAWMMAHAIHEICPLKNGRPTLAPKGTEIGIWGVDMEHGSEYTEQRHGFRGMIQAARMVGIDVPRVLTGGLIYEPLPYPHWQLDPVINKLDMRLNNAKNILAHKNDSLRETEESLAGVRAQLSEIELMREKEYDPQKRKTLLEAQYKAILDVQHSLSRDVVGWEAVLREQEWFKGYLMSCPGTPC